MLRIALLVVSVPLLAHGGERLYHAVISRTQAHVTCEQFVRERPSSRWLLLTDCEVDYVRAAYREERGRITELFFALRPDGSSPAEPAAIVLATRSPDVLALAEQTIGGRQQPDHESTLVMMLKIVTAMRATREVSGMTRSPLELLRTRRDLAAMRAPLADGFTVLDLHERPDLLYPALETAAGANALLVFVFLTVARARAGRRRAEAAAPATPPTEPRPEFRRLMLLNLPPQAVPAAIEQAPALGSREAVQAALEQVLPGIRFDEAGLAHFSRPDHQIAVELGGGPEVTTAIVDVTGDGAPLALKRLILQTGWRAYSPRLGRFIRAGDLT